MNKKQFKKAAALGLAGTMLFGTIMATSAAEPEDNPAITDAKVDFIAGEVDKEDPPIPGPEDPDEELVPPLVPGGNDNLVVFAPEFDFGTIQVVNENKEYPAKAQTLVKGKDNAVPDSIRYIRNYLAVSDQRGKNTGWNIMVEMKDPFTNNTAKNQTLDGVSVILKDGNIVSKTEGADLTQFTGVNSTGIKLGKDEGAHKVFYAEDGHGGGSYIQNFGAADTDLVPQVDVTSTASQKPNVQDALDQDVLFNNSVLLNVPQGTNPDAVQYKTSLIWTISDTPGHIIET